MEAQIDGKHSLLPVGTLLFHGTYRVVRHLASGGFGNTYEAVDTQLGGSVAIKEFFPKQLCGRSSEGGTVTLLSTDCGELFTQLRTKFKKEATRIRRLNHPHIVRVLAYFEEQGTAFYAMDFLRGESLSARMKRTGRPLTEAEVRRYLPQVLSALKEMHAKELWHLDLKPGNIMINERDEAVLIDFGASKQLRTEEGVSVSTSLSCAYTPGYAPLELVDQHLEKFGPWTDLYSLGATLYNLLTGARPLSPSHLIQGEQLAFSPSVSTAMQQLITWLMQPVMTKRPQSVGEVEAWLRKTNGAVVDTPQDNAARIPQSETVRPESVSTVCVDLPDQVTIPKDRSTTLPGGTSVVEKEEANAGKSLPAAPTKTPNKWKWLLGIAVAIAVITGVAVNRCISDRGGSAENTVGDSLAADSAVATIVVPDNCPKVIKKLAENMVYVEGGTFTMGATSEQGSDADSDEKPAHQVTLSSFYIGKYEVTQAEWQAVMGTNPSRFKGDNLPVENVSWDDCQEFIRKLNELTGKQFRLPTEAEWEYAARGGKRSYGAKYAGGGDIDNVAWYEGNSNKTTHPVGQKRPNELGLYDMSGNVWEWCQDYFEFYSSTSQTNPQGSATGTYRVLRGGSWNDVAWCCRLSFRCDCGSSIRSGNFGLRLALPNLQ